MYQLTMGQAVDALPILPSRAASSPVLPSTSGLTRHSIAISAPVRQDRDGGHRQVVSADWRGDVAQRESAALKMRRSRVRIAPSSFASQISGGAAETQVTSRRSTRGVVVVAGADRNGPKHNTAIAEERRESLASLRIPPQRVRHAPAAADHLTCRVLMDVAGAGGSGDCSPMAKTRMAARSLSLQSMPQGK